MWRKNACAPDFREFLVEDLPPADQNGMSSLSLQCARARLPGKLMILGGIGSKVGASGVGLLLVRAVSVPVRLRVQQLLNKISNW